MKIVRYNHKNKLLYPELSLAANIWVISTRNFEVNAHFTFKEDVHLYIKRSSLPTKINRLTLSLFSAWRPRGEDILFRDRIK